MHRVQFTALPSQQRPTADLDRRWAELTARSGLDPLLADRLVSEPATVLAEFGLSTEDARRAETLSRLARPSVTIESLSSPDTSVVVPGTVGACWVA